MEVLQGLPAWKTVVQNILSAVRPGTLPGGRRISGPKWQFPNGHIIDKFVSGRANVITTPENLRAFYLDGEKHGKHSNLGCFLDQILGRCIGFLEGDGWKQKRQIFYPPFSYDATANRIGATEGSARKFVDELPSLHPKAAQDDDGKKRVSFDIINGFRKFPLYLTASVLYGAMTDTEKADLWALAEKRLALWPYAVIGGPYRFSWGHWIDRTGFDLLKDFSSEWRKYNERLVLARRARGIKTPLTLFWDSYEAGEVTLENVMHSLDEILMTNLDVTAHAITWIITLIAEHKQAQQELRDEVDAHWNSLHEYLSESDTLLHRVFMETLRRSHLQTMVLVDVFAINVRNPFWGSDSEEFRPSRFQNMKPTDLRYNLIIFGFVGRKCPGQYMAVQGTKALLEHEGGNSQTKTETQVIPMADVVIQLTSRDMALPL
ncbi:cytochrome P450 [Aspergillus alliaceus]|uniref:cytochrome P450 n=1 Tax=Petromyces alliaceus TaxID=209559 RepID=UPI0012A75ECD|nr:cytochrome P450 [Aspergillus alliaceus]KAB8228304.1 cytochrome P450 [Aspergillus alliaceus]